MLELGIPMITLNCAVGVDYVAQRRSMHISWLLNSTQPIDIHNDRGDYRVQNCYANIQCENGYNVWVMTCILLNK